MISILLPAYKSEELLGKVFLKGLYNTDTKIETIFYDNGGNGFLQDIKETVEKFHMDHSLLKVVGDGKNIGLNAALNECAKVATGEWIFLPHTDMYLMPGWDTALLKEAEKIYPRWSFLFCSRSIEPTKGHTEYHIIKDYGKEWNEFEEKNLLEDFAGYSDNSVISGYRMPFFLHKQLWDRMDGVDPNYFSYCTDDDLVQTAYDVGVRRFWMVNNSLVYHLQGKSNKQQSIDRDSDSPYRYFIEKWYNKGYTDADHPARWHPKILPWYVRMK